MKNHRRRWPLLAALVLIPVVIVVAVLELTADSSKQTMHSGTTTPCPASASTTTIPTAPPADLRWQTVGAMLVPTSATTGPMRYRGAIWECYAHSPMGAVIAAYDIFAGLASPDWHAVAEHEAVPGAGQHAFIAAGNSQTYQPADPGQIAQSVGFEVVSYTPQQATVEALADAGDGYQADERTVAWENGDWKMVLTPDGTTGPDTQLVTSAGGFVLWGGAANG